MNTNLLIESSIPVFRMDQISLQNPLCLLAQSQKSRTASPSARVEPSGPLFGQRCVESKPVIKSFSLPPDLVRFASKRAFSAGLSFSRYVQLLLNLDREKNILAEAQHQKLSVSVPKTPPPIKVLTLQLAEAPLQPKSLAPSLQSREPAKDALGKKQPRPFKTIYSRSGSRIRWRILHRTDDSPAASGTASTPAQARTAASRARQRLLDA